MPILGSSADFTYQYSVTDPDNDVVNVVEKIDGKTIATKNAITLGATQTLSVSGNTFTALTNVKHTITITATDSAGNSAVRTLTFQSRLRASLSRFPRRWNQQPADTREYQGNARYSGGRHVQG